MKPNNHTLREFQSVGWRQNGGQDVTVGKEDFDAIWEYVLKQQGSNGGRVMIPGHEQLTARNYVGILQTRSGVTIEILPKVDISAEHAGKTNEREILLKMLRAWRNGPFREMSDADVRALRYFPLLECFITLFTKKLLALTRRGLASRYTPVEENLRVLKGKLLFARQMRHNLVHRERFYVAHEEFSANRPVNRLLKSALLHLERLSRDTDNQNRLRQARFYFDEVPQSTNITADFQRAQIDRTMPFYDQLIAWARLFLQGSAPSTYHGGHLSVALLFPMERIFEDYVVHQLRRECPNWEVNAQESRHYLVQKNCNGEREFKLRPDVVMRRDSELRIIDAKWKAIDRREKEQHFHISQTDLYQMFIYGNTYWKRESIAPTLYLIYPRNLHFNECIPFHFDDGLRLFCTPFDLADETAKTFVEDEVYVAA